MKKNFGTLLLFSTGVLLILSSCGFTAKPIATPTVDQQVIEMTVGAIQTQDVATSESRLTQAALANPTLPPTSTLLPSSTPYPTSTPMPTYVVLPTSTLIPMTAVPLISSTPTSYQCELISTSPTYGTTMAKGNDFDGNWVIQNTGTQNWVSTDVDIVYQSGTKFNKHDVYDMKVSVSPGDQATITVDYLAPSTSGTYTSTFALRRGTTIFCPMTITIVVN